MCSCRPAALQDLVAVLESYNDVLLVHVGGEELISVDFPVEGESHGLAIRVLVTRQGAAVADRAPVLIIRWQVVHLKRGDC